MEPSRRPASLQSERFRSGVRLQSELMAMVPNVAITGESGYGGAPDNQHATITHPKTSHDSDIRYRIPTSRFHENPNRFPGEQLMDAQQGMHMDASNAQLHVEDMTQVDRLKPDSHAANFRVFANEFDTGWPTCGNESAVVEDLHTRRLQSYLFQSLNNQTLNECEKSIFHSNIGPVSTGELIMMCNPQKDVQNSISGNWLSHRLEQPNLMCRPITDNVFANRDNTSCSSQSNRIQPLRNPIDDNETHRNCLPSVERKQSQAPPPHTERMGCAPISAFFGAEPTCFQSPPHLQSINIAVSRSCGDEIGHIVPIEANTTQENGCATMKPVPNPIDESRNSNAPIHSCRDQGSLDSQQVWWQPSLAVSNFKKCGSATISCGHASGHAPEKSRPSSTRTSEDGGESSPSAHRAPIGGKRRALTTQKKERKPKLPRKTADAFLSKVDSHRESHIWSERQRRRSMNQLYTTIRALLPHQSAKTDKATVVMDIINYIRAMQADLEVLSRRRDRLLAALNLRQQSSQVCSAHGLTCVDHTNDASALTAVTTLPPPGSVSCLTSFLGNNVAIHICGQHVFISITSAPQSRPGLLAQIITTLGNYNLNVLSATVNSLDNTTAYALSVETSQSVESLGDDLHTQLQIVINNFSLSDAKETVTQ